MADGAETTAEVGGGEAAAGSVDFSPLLERMDELSTGFGEIAGRFDGLEQQFSGPEEPEGEPDPWAELLGEEPQEEPAQDQRQLMQALAQASQASTQQQVEQAVAPLLEMVQRMQTDLAAQDLETRFEELRDPEVAREVMGQAVQWAQRLGVDPRNPAVVELAYLAGKAEKAAQSEVPAGDGHEGLESGGGVPQHRSEPDVRKGILAAGNGFSPWGGA